MTEIDVPQRKIIEAKNFLQNVESAALACGITGLVTRIWWQEHLWS
jgi:hypothetical protein